MNPEHALRFEVKSRSLKEINFPKFRLRNFSVFLFVSNNSDKRLHLAFQRGKMVRPSGSALESNSIVSQHWSFPCENTATIRARTVMSRPTQYNQSIEAVILNFSCAHHSPGIFSKPENKRQESSHAPFLTSPDSKWGVVKHPRQVLLSEP